MNNATAIGGLVIRSTAKALYLRINGCESDAWIPRSQISGWSEHFEDLNDGLKPLHGFRCSVPSWLYRKLPWNTRTAVAHRPW